MELITFLPSYFTWHYNTALRNIWGIVTNILWFFLHFFSVPLLVKTFFAPWRKLHESTHGFVPGIFFGNIIVNTIMRLVGMIVRAVTLLFAFLVFLVVCCSGMIIFITWLFAPVILLWLISITLFYFSHI